jgi:nucleolar protein 56
MGTPVLVTQWFGAFLHDDGEVQAKRLFPPDAEQVADRLAKVREDEVLYEEEELAAEVDDLAVPGDRLAGLDGATVAEGAVPREDPNDHGRDPSLRHEAALALTERTVHDQLSDQSRHLRQAVASLDEAHDIENRLGERLEAWFQLANPEVVERVESTLELARLVVKHGSGQAICEAKGWPTRLASPLSEPERQALEGLARSLIEQAESRPPLEDFIQHLAGEIAPNVATLTTPTIAARLIHHAGGLRELATAPASTIQMLGAEEAVFAHLVEDAPPPKHGVLYQHPLVHQAHPNDRGSIARAMAAKVAIAARADAFTGNDIAGELKAELEDRADEVAREGRRRAMNKGGG